MDLNVSLSAFVNESLAGSAGYDSNGMDGYDLLGGLNNTTTAEPTPRMSPRPIDDFPTWTQFFLRFNSFHRSHRYVHHIHGYLALVVCVLGIIANILNVAVLSRKNMISPTNCILIGLAVADMLVMCFYLPYCIMEFITEREQDCLIDGVMVACRSYPAVLYTLICSNATVVFHTVSTWLTVALAIFRWMAVAFPSHSRQLCSMKRAKIAIGLTYVGTFIACVPNYFSFTVHDVLAKGIGSGDTMVSYRVDFAELKYGEGIRKFNFWTYSVLMKLIPCLALTILSTALVRALCEAEDRRRRLKGRAPNPDGASSHNQRSADRTTRMLLAVLLLFIVTEFPAGVLSLLSGIDPDFFESYVRVGDIFDILALINSSVNFILYCTMSRQFRKTFALLFTPRWLKKWAPVMATEANATIATTCV
ncbi:sex peptide receptor-like [Galendromus occidentalis]|uniref:Sex peptide receptor-like n=1 Tax=Galendromus occidentalis TaxID=34638 RepID=A0AAJ6VZV7_9ACAR|nr:sex peptide receptor-like [Galendromus occidentalis]